MKSTDEAKSELEYQKNVKNNSHPLAFSNYQKASGREQNQSLDSGKEQKSPKLLCDF